MLMPFEYGLLSLEEANKLIEYIEKTTATKNNPQNYEKMRSVGILDSYNGLRNFVDEAYQYNKLKNLNVDDIACKHDIYPDRSYD